MPTLDHLRSAQADLEEALIKTEHADEELNMTPFNVPWITPTYHVQLTLHQLRVLIRCLEEEAGPPPP